jgi:hypothetical protein
MSLPPGCTPRSRACQWEEYLTARGEIESDDYYDDKEMVDETVQILKVKRELPFVMKVRMNFLLKR